MNPPTNNWGSRRIEYRFMRISEHETQNVKTHNGQHIQFKR